MSTHTNLKGVTRLGQVLVSQNLETNIVSFLQWAFLGIGAFNNVSIPTSGYYGGGFHQLRPVVNSEDPYYTSYRVYEGFRNNWVWEHDVENGYSPIQISGVYVNGNFVRSDATGAYAHHINYPQGRVVFDSPIASDSVVTCEYSYRHVNFTTDSVPWWREVQTNSYRIDNTHFQQQGSGDYAIMSQNRLQLPAVIVQVSQNTAQIAYEQGSSANLCRQDVYLHIITENPGELKFLHDTMIYLKDKTLHGFDENSMLENNAYPLDVNGTPVSGAKTYPELLTAHAWQPIKVLYADSGASPYPTSVWKCTARLVCETVIP